jgi:hypothetical protein
MVIHQRKEQRQMNTNGFQEHELVSRQVKVGNELQTRVFPVVGARLRLAHEENQNLSLQTELINWDGKYAVVKCCAVTGKGQFIGYGTANSQRDFEFCESLIELAETRSIARALRFAGFGVEYCGAEEVSHVPPVRSEPEQTAGKETRTVFQETNGNGEAKAQSVAASKAESKPSGNGGNGNSRATGAQVRALFALSKKVSYGQDDIANLLRPMNALTFEALSRENASRLISYLQTQSAQ